MKWESLVPPEMSATLQSNDDAVDPMELIRADVASLYGQISSEDPSQDLYGGLPAIAMALVSGNLSESHCERTISCANDIMTAGRTLLKTEELEMVVVLRMNKNYMEEARQR